MKRTSRTMIQLAVLSLAVAACAVRLGGPSPVQYSAAAMTEPAGADAAEVAQRIRSAGANVVLLAAERQDSAWFAAVGANAQLAVSGPGTTAGRGFAFLTNLEILGDTSLALAVPGGGQVHMHDALYAIGSGRYLDLMLVRLDAPDLRAAVRTLLGYIATDVGANAVLLLAVDAATPQLADSAAVLMRATLANAGECRGQQALDTTGSTVRLLFGPSARVRCRSAQLLPGVASGVVARLEVGR